ncbi:MAG: hypothetical protein NC418_02405 [Muribaculaceae bacterium]|nr:hypothetical protein [Muribaculaceae bacterium]
MEVPEYLLCSLLRHAEIIASRGSFKPCDTKAKNALRLITPELGRLRAIIEKNRQNNGNNTQGTI